MSALQSNVLASDSYHGLLALDQAVLDAIPAAVYVCAADGTISRFNQRAVELWGRAPELGDTDHRFCGAFRLFRMDGSHLPHAETPMERALRTGESADGEEVVIEQPDGRRVIVVVNIRALRDGSGQIRGAINCFQDATESKLSERKIRESEERARRLLDAIPAAVYSTDAEGRIDFYNRAAVELAGRTPALGEKWCVTWKLYTPDGAPLPHDQCPMAVALKEQRPVRGIEAIAQRPDGSRVPFQPFPTPMFDEQGRLSGAINMLVDISDLKRFEREARVQSARADDATARRLAEQAALYQLTDRLYRATSETDAYEAALDAIQQKLACNRAAVLVYNANGRLEFASSRGLSNGYRAQVEGHSPWSPDEADAQPIAIENVAASDLPDDLKRTVITEGIAALIFVPLYAGGRLAGKFMAYYDAPHAFSDHEIALALTIARQLGFSFQRQQAERERLLLINELNHRVKNTLATVQSFAMQTMRGFEGSALAYAAFSGRLSALSRAHDLLTSTNWSGADLSDVVRQAIAAFAGMERVEIQGERISLPPKRAMSLALALHELATNAAKYGALSTETGQIRISWRIEADVLELEWTERGGPPVQPPTSLGFGSRLIRVLGQDMGGSADVTYPSSGVVALIRAPVEDRSHAQSE